MIHLKNYENIFIKEFADPEIEIYGLKYRSVEGYPVKYIP
jgi:hypothetical protein